MQTLRIDSRIVGRMRRRMDPSVPRGIPLNRGGKSFRSPSRQTRQRREVGKNGGEGLNRARQSPRISPRSISFSCFSFQIFSLLGGFFLCGAGSGIPSFDRNGPSLRIKKITPSFECSRGVISSRLSRTGEMMMTMIDERWIFRIR